MMIKPVGTASPGASQAHGWSGQNSTHEIIGAVPFAQPASEHHEENRLGVLPDDVGAPNIRVGAVCSHAAHAAVAATAATVAPQISAGAEHRTPFLIGWRGILLVGESDGARSNQRFESAKAARGESFAIEIAEPISH